MKKKELLDLISQGESTTIEFKRKLVSPEKLSKEICAFTNTIGGYIFVGIDDDGSIIGIKSEKTEMDIAERSCNFFVKPPVIPEMEIISFKDKDILIIKISQSKQKPHKILSKDEKGEDIYKTYIRIGEKSVEASKEMTRLLTYQNPEAKPLKISIGWIEKELFSYLEKHERITLKEFCKLVNISERRAARVLIQLVRSGVIIIQNDETRDYYSLVKNIV